MSEEYWVFGELAKLFGSSFFDKEPNSISTILQKLRIGRGDRVLLTPRVLQNKNMLEFYTLYENKGRKAAERYMSLVVCEKPVEDILPITSLAKNLEDCADEEEKKLWLRVASPVADSAEVLGDFCIKSIISNKYLQKHRLKIIQDAHNRKILYHVHSRYCDEEQVLTDLALQYAF